MPTTTLLECHSRGDRRFSALYARLACGHTIEQVYQGMKRDEEGNLYPHPKGTPPARLSLGGHLVPCTNERRHLAYLALWHLYFREQPSLLAYASGFSLFRDLFDRQGGQVYTPRDEYLAFYYYVPAGVTNGRGEQVIIDRTKWGCCQAAAIAYCVGKHLDSECPLPFPGYIHRAIERYWTRYHPA